MIYAINILSTLVLGLYAGSLLTEAMILVPYWRRMKPAEFFGLHNTLGPRLYRYFAPLTTGAVVLTIAAAVLNRGENLAWNVTAALCISALIIFFIYFNKANKSFADHSLKDDELAEELTRWANWHWFRTVLIIIALTISIAGHLLTHAV
ncbi:MAG: hypothetical protein COA43_02855 [Robiginitomaculum sp.]|nr:MAG: hypothetical protein COA43_02855 [Robiginitomaculum sp.]